jgi:hypothetical protein
VTAETLAEVATAAAPPRVGCREIAPRSTATASCATPTDFSRTAARLTPDPGALTPATHPQANILRAAASLAPC